MTTNQTPAADSHLIWIDLEMTGLNPDHDEILEIATIVTDAQLNLVKEGPVLAIHQSELRLESMDHWNRKHHANSGLWRRVVASELSVQQAEAQTLEFLRQLVPHGVSPMCGNSICQDRRFLFRQMPDLERYFHYRNLDVSTVKELARRWCPGLIQRFKKKNTHLALEDIRESIAELRFYRQFMGKLSGQPGSGNE